MGTDYWVQLQRCGVDCVTVGNSGAKINLFKHEQNRDKLCQAGWQLPRLRLNCEYVFYRIDKDSGHVSAGFKGEDDLVNAVRYVF
jgi:hypothetical protein